ncbi:MAG: PilZ domain-containing protein [Nitrospirae bacterium]|nr:MAG: PilZ domain-containing protein [Nitrospirota bacterium]
MENNNRRETRYPLVKTIYYTAESGKKSDVFKGVVKNVSNSGLCIYLSGLVDEGKRISINSALPISCNKAVVRWVKQIDTGFYMAGLACA